jgi:hypothetical protein
MGSFLSKTADNSKGKKASKQERNPKGQKVFYSRTKNFINQFLFVVLAILGLELRAYILSHSSSPFF